MLINGTFLRKIKEIHAVKVSRREWKYALSRESPLQSNSSIFFVIILVTSCRSSLSLSRFEVAALAVLESRYSLAVFDIKVSIVGEELR